VTAREDSIAVVRADLPNTPDEILDVWLKPYVEILGWPPCSDIHTVPGGRWRGILSKRPVAFWARVRWRQENGAIEFHELDDDSLHAVVGLRDAHVFGITNAYSEITDGGQRLTDIISYVLKHGCIPSAVIFLETGSQLSVIDGHHRLVAYFLNRDSRFREKLPPGVAEFNATVRKWIGRYGDDAG
jgi:hypothetical protein